MGGKKGYTSNISFATFKPKLKTTQKKVIFLTWPELTQLRNYAIPQEKQYLERVRDVFYSAVLPDYDIPMYLISEKAI